MAFTCPKDPTHRSSDADYCSECGAKIAGVSMPTASIRPSSTDAVCPDCGTPRTGDARFCEVCRHDFESGTSSGLAPSATPPIPAPAPPVAPVIPNYPSRKYDAVAIVDPTLYTDPDPSLPLPVGEPEHVFPLDFAENLVGRRSESRGIYPEVLLRDPGVSARHAKLLIEGDTIYLLELGSTNGTRLNGIDVEVGIKTPVNPGDVIALGCWTRLDVRER